MNMTDAPRACATAAEAARRTLKLLTERRQIPTPESFAEAYYEITGYRSGGTAAPAIRDVLRDFVRHGRLSSQEAALTMQRAKESDWRAVHETISTAVERRAGATNGNWPGLALALLKQTDGLHASWTRARKLDAVTRVIEVAGDQPDVALERLVKLVDSWGPALAADKPAERQEAPHAGVSERPARAAGRTIEAAADDDSQNSRAAAGTWQQVALRALRLLEQSCGLNAPAAEKLRDYARRNAQPNTEDIGRLVARFTDVAAAVERRLEEQNKIRAGLARMLRLVFGNIQNLAPEENWLAGQLEPIRALLDGPLTADELSTAEHSLALLIERQVGARRGLQDTRLALKEMLAELIERIGAMGDSTGRFYDQIGDYQARLQQANDLETLSTVIGGLLADTHVMRADIQSSRDELLEARRKVETYELRVRELERELSEAESLVQRDPLTHARNRRGLEEAFKVESARARRYGADMTFLLLDVDDFKRVNDSFGHLGGDRALVHLAQTLHATLRPTDLLFRLGGEEFGVLLPATSLDDARAVAERLRHELARRPVELDGRPCVLTFSGGLALWRHDESTDQWIERADAAMYRAKREGKDRIEVAE